LPESASGLGRWRASAGAGADRPAQVDAPAQPVEDRAGALERGWIAGRDCKALLRHLPRLRRSPVPDCHVMAPVLEARRNGCAHPADARYPDLHRVLHYRSHRRTLAWQL
jgi:hypothetical protein